MNNLDNSKQLGCLKLKAILQRCSPGDELLVPQNMNKERSEAQNDNKICDDVESQFSFSHKENSDVFACAQQRLYPCKVCDKSFKTKQRVLEHL